MWRYMLTSSYSCMNLTLGLCPAIIVRRMELIDRLCRRFPPHHHQGTRQNGRRCPALHRPTLRRRSRGHASPDLVLRLAPDPRYPRHEHLHPRHHWLVGTLDCPRLARHLDSVLGTIRQSCLVLYRFKADLQFACCLIVTAGYVNIPLIIGTSCTSFDSATGIVLTRSVAIEQLPL